MALGYYKHMDKNKPYNLPTTFPARALATLGRLNRATLEAAPLNEKFVDLEPEALGPTTWVKHGELPLVVEAAPVFFIEKGHIKGVYVTPKAARMTPGMLRVKREMSDKDLAEELLEVLTHKVPAYRLEGPKADIAAGETGPALRALVIAAAKLKA